MTAERSVAFGCAVHDAKELHERVTSISYILLDRDRDKILKSVLDLSLQNAKFIYDIYRAVVDQTEGVS